jgi:hypothetical protein
MKKEVVKKSPGDRKGVVGEEDSFNISCRVLFKMEALEGYWVVVIEDEDSGKETIFVDDELAEIIRSEEENGEDVEVVFRGKKRRGYIEDMAFQTKVIWIRLHPRILGISKVETTSIRKPSLEN